MAKPKTKKKEYLNSTNAASVASRGRYSAYTATQGILKKGEDGKWSPSGDMMTRSATGRMSEDGKRAGGKTWTFTPKNDDGSPVLGKNGKPRQSGRSQIATRRQRYYDVRVGLGLAGG